jgi:amino acid transporter
LTGDLETLADTTVVLLMVVFAIINISVLALRRDEVDHPHFRAPTALPVLGAIVSLVLITQNEAAIFVRAGILLIVGAVLWLINWMAGGRSDKGAADRTA